MKTTMRKAGRKVSCKWMAGHKCGFVVEDGRVKEAMKDLCMTEVECDD